MLWTRPVDQSKAHPWTISALPVLPKPSGTFWPPKSGTFSKPANTGRHCYWPDHCSRPSHPHPQPLRSAQAPEGPERSGGGAKRLAAARNARATLLGDGLGPARSSPNHPSRPIATHPSGGRPRAHQDPRSLSLSHCPQSEVQLSSLPSCKKVESPSRPRHGAISSTRSRVHPRCRRPVAAAIHGNRWEVGVPCPHPVTSISARALRVTGIPVSRLRCLGVRSGP